MSFPTQFWTIRAPWLADDWPTTTPCPLWRTWFRPWPLCGERTGAWIILLPPAGIFDEPARVDHQACFDVRRWTASLVAQHMLRHGMSESIHRILPNTWWDAGNVARRALDSDVQLENAEMNWASWMYLGWMFDPGRHASVYTGSGLKRIGLPRHATFVALKSLVSRPEGSAAVWPDARNTAKFAPRAWAFDATRVAYEHLIERLTNGERPAEEEGLTKARMFVNRAYDLVVRKVDLSERNVLGALRDALLQGLV